ncbi:MAG: DUF2478 domain-containing protein [Rhodobacteraceae bacterium]|nr:DUF2478 domain-containing protein [Paracoccaceae bacterium]
MLGYLITDGQGTADRLLAGVADTLAAEGWPLAGAVQINSDAGTGRPCDMDLNVLAARRIIRISQNLGKLAKGCRLDPDGLEQAVGLVAGALSGPERPRLLIVNRFGKQEADGRGFRPLIGQALAEGIPVLTSVGRANLPVFQSFAEGFAEELAPDLAALLVWCQRNA